MSGEPGSPGYEILNQRYRLIATLTPETGRSSTIAATNVELILWSTMNASIYYIWILWIIAIPLAPFMGWLCQKYWTCLNSFLRRTMLVFFAASITVGLCTIFTPWSFRGFWMQAVNLVLAYSSAICLVCLAFRKSAKSLSPFAARGIAVFVALLVCFSLFADYWRTDLPDAETKLGDHLILRRCSGGWAGIDWEGVTIVQQPPWLPVLEKRLYSVHIGVAGDCDATSVRVDTDPVSHEIRVQCGRQNPYVFARVKMP